LEEEYRHSSAVDYAGVKECWMGLLFVSEKERNNTTREDTRGSGGIQ